jgi:hypothetical protein
VSASTSVGPSADISSSEDDDVDARSKHVARQKEEIDGLNCAVEAAMSIFKDAWTEFAIECDVGFGGFADKDTRENRAARVCEGLVVKRYDQMKRAFCDLLPWVGPVQPRASGTDYDVLEFQGHQVPRHVEKALKDSELSKAQLKWLRNEPRGRAWEAFCAVMAALSTRKEKCWLDAHDRDNLEAMIGPKQGVAGAGALRKLTISTHINEECAAGCGFFSHYLVHSYSKLRVAFAPGMPTPMPASLIITSRLPMWEALASMDDNGPLRGEAASREWCLQAGRQFALQDANLEVEKGARNDRDASSLQPDAKLRDLIRSRKPVVVLEVVAALAPRAVAKNHGLSDIVKAELARVMSEAKSKGEAVLFYLGSDIPHALARKVYMQPPINNHGLRCGYLRWRASATAAWGRERAWDTRLCLCLQMP